jgi:glycosyltransferase involved in cell wall biosynthesis
MPEPERAWSMEKKGDGTPTVCAFSVAPGPAGSEEVDRIGNALGYAAKSLGKIRLMVAGRNSEEAGRQLQQELANTGVEVVVHGVLPAGEIARVLGACDVMLFPRGGISSRRSSALAGIACGLPVIASEGPETAAPLTEAGVVLLPAGANEEFGPALVRVLTDNTFRETLAKQSRLAQERHFSWSAIAAQYAKALSEAESQP